MIPSINKDYTAAASMAEQKRTSLLDSGTFTHRVTSQQPIEYDIEGLKYEGPHKSGVLRPHYKEDEIPLSFTRTIA